MLIISNLLISASNIISIVLGACILLIFIESILRWIKFPTNNIFQERVRQLTAPLYNCVKRRIPTTIRGFDFTAQLVFLLLIFLRSFLVGFLTDLANVISKIN